MIDGKEDEMTTVFFHAIFRTMDEEKPLVTAVSVKDGRILGTGDQASLCAALDAAGSDPDDDFEEFAPEE